LLVFAMLAAAIYGWVQGTQVDIVNAVRRGDVDAVRAALARDPSLVHTRVYPQGYERASDQQAYLTRTGRSAWTGRVLVHEAADHADQAVALLELLAGAGADLHVRLDGRTLLHRAVHDGRVDVATWLLDHGADVDAPNACEDGCAERGETPLHEPRLVQGEAMVALLMARGAALEAATARGRTPLHRAAQAGQLGNAVALCRYGADPARVDAEGQTPYDLARAPGIQRDTQLRSEDLRSLEAWLAPAGGCAQVSATARAGGAPVSDDAARQVFAATVREGAERVRGR
jgi:hypothetical protein